MGLPSSRGWDRSTRRPSACPGAEARSRERGVELVSLPTADAIELLEKNSEKQQCCPPCDLLIFTNPSSDPCGKKCSALFRVRVGTLCARGLTDPKYLTSKNAQDGSHQVAEARSSDGTPVQVLIERVWSGAMAASQDEGRPACPG